MNQKNAVRWTNVALILALCLLLTPMLLQARPVPVVTATAADPQFRLQLAEHYAPVWQQFTVWLYSRADYILKFDYDGDWKGINNWDNLYAPGIQRDLKAYVYYAVVETETHWFITYAIFHPADWGEWLTDDCVCIPGVGCSCHENDMEGALIVVKKDGSPYGELQAVETVHHNDFFVYAQDERIHKQGDWIEWKGYIQNDDLEDQTHIILKVDRRGHAVQTCTTGDCDFAPRIIYRYHDGTPEQPSSGDDSDVGYALIDLEDSQQGLWPRREQYGDEYPFDDYGIFRGDDYGVNKAHAPWGWEEGSGVPCGWNFSNPAWAVDYHLDLSGLYSDGEQFSKTYLYNPFCADPNHNNCDLSSSPSLSLASISPGDVGDSATVFSFNITYTDPENHPPALMQIVVNGTPLNMTPTNPSDTNYTNGARYEYSASFSPGNYLYYYTASDGTYTVEAADVSNFRFTVTSPSASGVTVTANPTSVPMDGVSTSAISALVTDSDGDPMANETVCFDADKGFAFSPGCATTNLSGVATTQFQPYELGITTITANATNGASGSTTVEAYAVPGAYDILLSTQVVESTDTHKAYAVNVWVTYASNGQTVYNKTITLETSLGTFQNGQQAISVNLNDGELDPFDPNYPVKLTVTTPGHVGLAGTVEGSSGSIGFDVVLGAPTEYTPITSVVGTRSSEALEQADHEVSWSSDGHYLATLSGSTAYVWRTSDWSQYAAFNTGVINAIEISPQGTYLAVASVYNLHVFRLSDKSLWWHIYDDSTMERNSSVTWSDDESWLALSNMDTTVRIYNVSGKYLERTLTVPSSGSTGPEELFCVDWQGDRLAAAGEGGYGYIWNTTNWSRILPDFDVHLDKIYSTRWSPDSQYVAFGGRRWQDPEYNLVFVDRFGNLVGNKRYVSGPHIYSLDWSPDSSKLVYSNDAGNAYVIDPSGNELAYMSQAGRWSVDWSSQGYIAVVGDDVKIYPPPDEDAPGISQSACSPCEGQIGTVFTLSASVTDTGSGVVPGSVVAKVQYPDETDIATLQLYDDGSSGGDVVAGDGVFTGQWDSSGVTEGPYLVDLTASDGNDNVREVENALTISVYDSPQISNISRYPTQPTTNDTVVISATITDSSGIALANVLFSTDGGASWTSVKMVLDTSPNCYSGTILGQLVERVSYKIEATDQFGHTTNSNIFEYDVIGPPIAAFSSSSPDWLGQPTTFTNMTVASGTTTYLWSFGDTATSTLESPTYVYADPGFHMVSLVSTNQAGHDIATDFVTIYGPPTADFVAYPITGSCPLAVAFTDTTTTTPPGDPTLTHLWHLGDGETSTLSNPVHTYTTVGVYTVTLAVSNAAGSDITTHTRYITVQGHNIYLPLTLRNYATAIGPPNHSPNTPSNPAPANNAIDQSVNVLLSWVGGDPDGDTVTYDIYFEAGDSTPDILVADDQSSTTYNPGTLILGTHYYWKIEAKDEHGATTAGVVWDFTTETGGSARPGDYTAYSFDSTAGPFFNLDIYSTWEAAPSTGYIYPAFQFFFQANQGGYMGMQLVGTQKKALFSIWDTTEGSGTAQPVSDWCDRFGGEGTGARCLIDYDWVPEREYRLRVWAVGSDQDGESWIGAIQDTVTGIETQIGVIYLYDSGGYTGYGWLRTDAYTFLEYFGGSPGCDNHPYSRVLWRGPFANADGYTAGRAVVPAYPDCTHNNVSTGGWPYVTHEAGGTTMLTTPASTVLWDVP